MYFSPSHLFIFIVELFACSKSVINLLINIEKEIRYNLGSIDEPHGSLSVKVPQSVSTYLLPRLLKDFSIIFPGIRIDFDWCTHFSLAEAFDSGNTDLAFLITNNFDSKTIKQEVLFKVNLNIICHSHNPLARKSEIGIPDFKNQILILSKSDCSYGHILEEYLKKAMIILEKNISDTEYNVREFAKAIAIMSSN